ncbi:MAG: hypothetical protein HXS41_02795 [Theionarchaea archaeon]|nr:hypothetical protein [Theionarchaea archaeon]MBU7001183.1 hypothetical protein [Theionarchaea archaeon]MBU7019962.1 hypothetical protein [Theionarchaea archaeon]MBU7034054.1 hypothetical protein [Theionarchaea archaeon]MBU7039589.1 hypothetical protein [Theionarchaea archaeon]
MIKIQIKNLEDFKKVIRNRSTVYFTREHDTNSERHTYYVLSKESGVDIVIIFVSEEPLRFVDEYNPEESEGINVTYLIEIEELVFCCLGDSSC